MTDSKRLARLTELFRKLGAPDPEGWAESEVQHGIPQTARYLFLRQAWRNIASVVDTSWIEAGIADARRRPDGPYAGAGHALARLRARGATNQELAELVRGMQAELLFSFCYLLEDPGAQEAEVEDVCWALFLTDEEGQPIRHVNGLHESVLETDPLQREVRPPEEWYRD